MKYLLLAVAVVAAHWTAVWYTEPVQMPAKAPAPAVLQNVYYKILKETGQQGTIPPLYMWNHIASLYITNAFVTSDGIYFTYGMLMFAQNEDELAAIMAHEMSHKLLGHLDGDTRPSVIQEAMADQLGAYLLIKAGYNPCAAKRFWQRVRDNQGDLFLSTHPAASVRVEIYNLPQCRGN